MAVSRHKKKQTNKRLKQLLYNCVDLDIDECLQTQSPSCDWPSHGGGSGLTPREIIQTDLASLPSAQLTLATEDTCLHSLGERAGGGASIRHHGWEPRQQRRRVCESMMLVSPRSLKIQNINVMISG